MSTPLVVDASVAVKWFIPEIHSEAACRLLATDYRLFAPELILAEVGNVLWKKWRRSELAEDEVHGIVKDLLRMPLGLVRMGAFLAHAETIAVRYQRSVYDSMYLALAMRRRIPFDTADQRLFQALQATELAAGMIWVESIV